MKSNYCFFGLFTIALAVVISTGKLALAVNADNPPQSNTSSAELENILSDLSSKGHSKINLTIRIVVPHNKDALDSCRIYPYPVAPPKKKKDPDKIPLTDKALRSMALSMSFWTKSRKDKAYPSGGWRMQHILDIAMQKSGLGPPHTIFTEYSWVENIIPYIRKEAIIVNAKEADRVNRYNSAQTVFSENRADLEVQSFNQGLFPIDVPIRREAGGYRRGQVTVDKANWWIVAMHKIPGLKYYWLWPVTLSDSPEQTVTLDEDNAIYIEGAW